MEGLRLKVAGRKKGLHLRKGFTTGTCAAAGAKAAAQALFGAVSDGSGRPVRSVQVTLPLGGSIRVKIKSLKVEGRTARASVIKDAGDDPDVTNGEEIITGVELVRLGCARPYVRIKGGAGVGVVTRPGLKVPPGRPAINPVPLKMIRAAVLEAAESSGVTPSVTVTVSVPRGMILAEKTMNPRLGIVGGISILGTTGIVEPLSLCAYRNSITCGIDVAVAGGMDEVIFSTGRSTERVVEKRLRLPEIAFVLTGDHMGAALKDASKKRGLKKVTVAGQFGKMSKLAAGHFETHRDDSSVELETIAGLCRSLGDGALAGMVLGANTAREVYFILKKAGRKDVFRAMLKKVRENARVFLGSDIEIRCVLVGYEDDMAATLR